MPSSDRASVLSGVGASVDPVVEVFEADAAPSRKCRNADTIAIAIAAAISPAAAAKKK